jgi:surface antigen
MKNRATLSRALLLALCLLAPSPVLAKSRFLQCVPFAREISGIEIHGNAKTWWHQAEGKYQRGQTPQVGAVMALPGIRSMPLGHVATVSKIISDREILLTHANWSRRGGIERNVRALDVSANGDWSRVRIWFAGNGDLGMTTYPVSGFIYPVRVNGAPINAGVQWAATAPLAAPLATPKAPKTLRGPLLGVDVFVLAENERRPNLLLAVR